MVQQLDSVQVTGMHTEDHSRRLQIGQLHLAVFSVLEFEQSVFDRKEELFGRQDSGRVIQPQLFGILDRLESKATIFLYGSTNPVVWQETIDKILEILFF